MCNVLVASTIVEVLEQKFLNKEIFTAYDITVEARAATDDNVRHDDVRSIVNNEFITNQMAGYERELCTLDLSSKPQAFVYFPDTMSANDYPLIDDSVAPVVNTVSTSAPVSTVAVDLSVDEYATTKEGRVQIPRKLTNQVTPNGGTYDVLINGDIKCASSDARGDVRIGLRQFGIKDSKVKVTVDTNNNTIIIETV